MDRSMQENQFGKIPHQPALPHHRHQSSLEGLIDFSAKPPLSEDERDQAKRKFYHVVEHFEVDENGQPSSNRSRQYNPPKLIRYTYEYARSPLSKDNFLQAFFKILELSIDGDEDIDLSGALEEQIRSSLFGFADDLINNFFLPLKASTGKTPQPSPAYHSAIRDIQGGVEFAGTPDRMSALRGACLVRDRHRCVVSRRFDQNEGVIRMKKAGENAQDDDGGLLEEDPMPWEALEVAHILPHSLTKLGGRSELVNSKQTALAILNMFDVGVGYSIEGVEIDRPRNALTLAPGIHRWFGNFDIFFESVPDSPHTYRIDSFLPARAVRGILPVTRTLHLIDTQTIDPPSPRLLAIHSAIAHILHLSAAGDYIDEILRDMERAEELGAQTDGSTDLGRLVYLRMWLDGGVDAY